MVKWSIESSNEPVRLDNEGVWWQGDTRVTHPRVESLLSRHLQRGAEGWEVAVGNQRMVALVDDSPFYVIQCNESSTGWSLALNDGGTEQLDPAQLWITPENVIYTWVRGGRYLARFKRKAVHQLAERITQRNGVDGIEVGGAFHPIHPLPEGQPRWRDLPAEGS